MGKKKAKKGIVYSTDPDYEYTYDEEQESQTVDPNAQTLTVLLDKKQRAGKQVSLVEGFVGARDDLQQLGKMIKVKCGVGGTVKDGQIIIQGDRRQQIKTLLEKEGYNVKVR